MTDVLQHAGRQQDPVDTRIDLGHGLTQIDHARNRPVHVAVVNGDDDSMLRLGK